MRPPSVASSTCSGWIDSAAESDDEGYQRRLKRISLLSDELDPLDRLEREHEEEQGLVEGAKSTRSSAMSLPSKEGTDEDAVIGEAIPAYRTRSESIDLRSTASSSPSASAFPRTHRPLASTSTVSTLEFPTPRAEFAKPALQLSSRPSPLARQVPDDVPQEIELSEDDEDESSDEEAGVVLLEREPGIDGPQSPGLALPSPVHRADRESHVDPFQGRPLSIPSSPPAIDAPPELPPPPLPANPHSRPPPPPRPPRSPSRLSLVSSAHSSSQRLSIASQSVTSLTLPPSNSLSPVANPPSPLPALARSRSNTPPEPRTPPDVGQGNTSATTSLDDLAARAVRSYDDLRRVPSPATSFDDLHHPHPHLLTRKSSTLTSTTHNSDSLRSIIEQAHPPQPPAPPPITELPQPQPQPQAQRRDRRHRDSALTFGSIDVSSSPRMPDISSPRLSGIATPPRNSATLRSGRVRASTASSQDAIPEALQRGLSMSTMATVNTSSHSHAGAHLSRSSTFLTSSGLSHSNSSSARSRATTFGRRMPPVTQSMASYPDPEPGSNRSSGVPRQDFFDWDDSSSECSHEHSSPPPSAISGGSAQNPFGDSARSRSTNSLGLSNSSSSARTRRSTLSSPANGAWLSLASPAVGSFSAAGQVYGPGGAAAQGSEIFWDDSDEDEAAEEDEPVSPEMFLEMYASTEGSVDLGRHHSRMFKLERSLGPGAASAYRASTTLPSALTSAPNPMAGPTPYPRSTAPRPTSHPYAPGRPSASMPSLLSSSVSSPDLRTKTSFSSTGSDRALLALERERGKLQSVGEVNELETTNEIPEEEKRAALARTRKLQSLLGESLPAGAIRTGVGHAHTQSEETIHASPPSTHRRALRSTDTTPAPSSRSSLFGLRSTGVKSPPPPSQRVTSPPPLPPSQRVTSPPPPVTEPAPGPRLPSIRFDRLSEEDEDALEALRRRAISPVPSNRLSLMASFPVPPDSPEMHGREDEDEDEDEGGGYLQPQATAVKGASRARTSSDVSQLTVATSVVAVPDEDSERREKLAKLSKVNAWLGEKVPPNLVINTVSYPPPSSSATASARSASPFDRLRTTSPPTAPSSSALAFTPTSPAASTESQKKRLGGAGGTWKSIKKRFGGLKGGSGGKGADDPYAGWAPPPPNMVQVEDDEAVRGQKMARMQRASKLEKLFGETPPQHLHGTPNRRPAIKVVPPPRTVSLYSTSSLVLDDVDGLSSRRSSRAHSPSPASSPSPAPPPAASSPHIPITAPSPCPSDLSTLQQYRHSLASLQYLLDNDKDSLRELMAYVVFDAPSDEAPPDALVTPPPVEEDPFAGNPMTLVRSRSASKSCASTSHAQLFMGLLKEIQDSAREDAQKGRLADGDLQELMLGLGVLGRRGSELGA